MPVSHEQLTTGADKSGMPTFGFDAVEIPKGDMMTSIVDLRAGQPVLFTTTINGRHGPAEVDVLARIRTEHQVGGLPIEYYVVNAPDLGMADRTTKEPLPLLLVDTSLIEGRAGGGLLWHVKALRPDERINVGGPENQTSFESSEYTGVGFMIERRDEAVHVIPLGGAEVTVDKPRDNTQPDEFLTTYQEAKALAAKAPGETTLQLQRRNEYRDAAMEGLVESFSGKELDEEGVLAAQRVLMADVLMHLEDSGVFGEGLQPEAVDAAVERIVMQEWLPVLRGRIIESMTGGGIRKLAGAVLRAFIVIGGPPPTSANDFKQRFDGEFKDRSNTGDMTRRTQEAQTSATRAAVQMENFWAAFNQSMGVVRSGAGRGGYMPHPRP